MHEKEAPKPRGCQGGGKKRGCLSLCPHPRTPHSPVFLAESREGGWQIPPTPLAVSPLTTPTSPPPRPGAPAQSLRSASDAPSPPRPAQLPFSCEPLDEASWVPRGTPALGVGPSRHTITHLRVASQSQENLQPRATLRHGGPRVPFSSPPSRRPSLRSSAPETSLRSPPAHRHPRPDSAGQLWGVPPEPRPRASRTPGAAPRPLGHAGGAPCSFPGQAVPPAPREVLPRPGLPPAAPPHLRVCTVGLYLPLFLFLKSEFMVALGVRGRGRRVAAPGGQWAAGGPRAHEGQATDAGERAPVREPLVRRGAGARSLLPGGGAPAGLRLSWPHPEKVALTFPGEGPPGGRGFQPPPARALGLVRASGAPGRGCGWDAAHPPRPPHSCGWQVGRGAQAALPGTPSPTLAPPPRGLARPLAEGLT